MKDVSHPLALAALGRALKTVRIAPTPRMRTDSRTADKFVVNAFVELLSEVEAIGRHQGRSTNSEVVAAILDALEGHQRTHAMLRVLKQHVGEHITGVVLAAVPDFVLEQCTTRKKFVVRMPDLIRERVRDGVSSAVGEPRSEKTISMNKWLLNALVAWVNIQRQHYALLSAAITMDQALLKQST